jgi:hypothetical protein
VEDGMSDFASNLQAQLEADPDLKRRGRRLLKVLQEPDSPRKARIVARMEAHARAHLEMMGMEAIDWSAIDWKSIIEGLLKVLLALLPLLLAL